MSRRDGFGGDDDPKAARALDEARLARQGAEAHETEQARTVAKLTRANTTVAHLTEAAHKIGAVVKLISGIAAQANLLALNATIEAARGRGRQGRPGQSSPPDLPAPDVRPAPRTRAHGRGLPWMVLFRVV